ncbi:MAG: hypothetical protein IAE79_11265 [Anaerolinea sp.]|nr:hypothetical protein [Anaerolinea sp.]
MLGETGRVTLSNSIDNGIVETVNLAYSYHDPVVVAFINSANGTESVEVRVRNVTSDSFEVFMEEPDDQSHQSETISYIVLEKGHYQLDGGLEIAAGTVETDAVHRTGDAFAGEPVTFTTPFAVAPAILHTLNSYNNGAFMSSIAHASSAAGFTIQQEAGGTGATAVTDTWAWVDSLGGTAVNP